MRFTILMILGLLILAPSILNAQVNESNSKDLCTVTEFPYIVDFEADGLIPGCWEQDGINDHDWIFDDDSGEGAHQGSYYAMFPHVEYGNIGMIMTPQMDLSSLTSPKLTFWHSQQAYGDDQDELTVYYRTSESDPWNILPGGFFTNDIPSWTMETILLPNPSATYQIGFEAYDDYGYGVRLDYVVVSEEVCATPSDITLSNVTYSAADLSWTANGGENNWNLIISYEDPVVDFESASTIDIIANPQYDIVGMQSNTKYYIYTQAICSDDDVSDWAESYVLTDCEWFADLPLEENFDESWTNWCWRVIDNDNDGETWQKTALWIDPLSPPSTAFGAGNQDDYLILPKMQLSDNFLLKWFDVVETSEHNNTYEVLVSTTNSDLDSFVSLATYDCTNENWTQHVLSLNDFNGESIYVAFHQTYSSSLVHGFGIDNVQVVQGISGIEAAVNDNNISIYPNPNNGIFNLDLNLENTENIVVEILDITGRFIEKRSLFESTSQISFDLSHLNKGIYLVNIRANGEEITKKISIE